MAREACHPWRERHPFDRGAREDVGPDLGPASVVESPGAHHLHHWKPLGRQTKVGSAPRTELNRQHPPMILGPIVIAAQWPTGELNVFFEEHDGRSKRRSGGLLTERAVARKRTCRRTFGFVPH